MQIKSVDAFAKIGKKAFICLVMMLLLSMIVFFMSKRAPGDPLQSFYGDAIQSMTTEEQTAARERLGLNGPVFLQYGKWIERVFQGDFGLSLKYKKPVVEVVSPLIQNTLILGGTSYALVFVLAILLAVFCASHEDSLLDKIICKVGTAFNYIPAFWFGVVLVLIFSVNLKLLPSSGAYDIGKANDIVNRLKHMVLPLTVMVLSHLWYYAYMIRNKLLDEIRKDYVLLARSKGLGKARIIWGHCLRNILPTLVSMMAISVPHVLSGTTIAESVFNYPGIGSLAVTSAKYHDYNLLMLMSLIIGAFVILSSLAAQLINEKIDPRLKSMEGVDEWNSRTTASSLSARPIEPTPLLSTGERVGAN